MKNSNVTIDPKKLSTFLGLTAVLAKPKAVVSISGQWAILDSPFKWGDDIGNGTTAGAHIAEVKKLGFKTAWTRGGRIGVSVKDLAKAA